MKKPPSTIQTPALPAHLTARAWPTKKGYKDKIDAIRHGGDPELWPGEFLRYVLIDRDKKLPEAPAILSALEQKMGYAPHYLRSDVFNNPHPLSLPLQEKLAGLTGKNYSFWEKPIFSSRDAEGITFNMSADITAIVDKYAHIGGAPMRRINNARVQSKQSQR